VAVEQQSILTCDAKRCDLGVYEIGCSTVG